MLQGHRTDSVKKIEPTKYNIHIYDEYQIFAHSCIFINDGEGDKYCDGVVQCSSVQWCSLQCCSVQWYLVQ